MAAMAGRTWLCSWPILPIESITFTGILADAAAALEISGVGLGAQDSLESFPHHTRGHKPIPVTVVVARSAIAACDGFLIVEIRDSFSAERSTSCRGNGAGCTSMLDIDPRAF